ncbi:MFS transporter [Tabrizicola sp.]|uniref:MFS transporter n=1 Tax=Tabrizicola sp. TaxID=2005166 RepID=UPI002616C5A1|nr:MFS transporter [Tabrizicola sp.]MDM7932299.1 MFS transporter [Tabrizicola sp.]
MKDLIRANAGLMFAGVATFVMMGAGQSLYGPALPAFSRLFNVSVAEAGVLVSAHWVGCFIGVGFMYLKGSTVTPRHALAAMAIGAAGVAALAGWWATIAGAVVFGMGYGMSTAVFNPRVLRAFGSKGPSMLSLLNATFGVGAIAAPLIFVALGSDPRWSFGLTAALAAVIWLFADPAGRTGAAPAAEVRAFRPHVGILAFGAVAIGMEACLIGLGPTALIQAGVAEATAAELLSAFFVVFLLSRVALIFVAHRVEPFVLYTLAIAVAAVCALGSALVSPALFFVAMGAPAGLFFPGFYVTASGKMGEDLRVPPTIIASGLVGGIGAPLIVAPLMVGMGERGFFWLVAGVTVTLTVAAVLSLRRMKV